jgi:hypothetical protein
MIEAVASGSPSDPDEIEAELLFVDPAGGVPKVHLAKPSEVDPERTRGAFMRRKTAVRNGRRLGGGATLDEEGFAFIRHHSEVRDFYDDAQIRAVYYPEMEALVKELTGARRAIVFDHTVRGTHAGRRGGVEVELPSDMMHCDFTAASALETLQYLVPSEERDAMRQGRILQMNLWRPIRGPLRTMPLAVCDASSVRPESCIEAPFVRPDFESEYTLLAFDPGQRWYYLPDMRADEVIVIKNYDSDESKSRFAIHGAFADPGAPPDAPPRESIEVRVFASLG